MDIVTNNLYGGLKLQPPIPTPQQSTIIFPPPHLHYSSDASFPIIAIAIVGIIATAFLLVSYYIFVIKCCLNWHSRNLLNHFSTSINQNQDDPLMDATFETSSRGLEDSVIRSIPMFKFGKEATKLGNNERSICICECVVCLNEFQEDERLRIIPNCSHVFHLDCIDAWLKNNANCPLCRTSISGSNVIAPSSTNPQDPTRSEEEEDEDDYVVIELGDYSNVSSQEKLNPGELSAVERRISPCPRKFEIEQRGVKKIWRKFSEAGCMGDEYIDVRVRSHDDEFGLIQPIRRSFSMDSLVDGHLLLGVQEIVEGSSSNSSSCRRTCFSFGHGCRGGSRSAILPVKLEP